MLYYKKYRLFIGIFSVLVIGGFFCTYYAKDTENTNPKNSTMEQHPLPAKEIISHLPSDGGKEYNRLVFEQSPYLLQHARNPVDWYPWGKAAFKKARKENKPVFLSIGYSTCHWCHVMERESFEDQDVAELLNANYIAIKVDREERPDIDDVYMTVTQTLTGSGGWPMTVIMTPDKKPFFAGTYFPKHGKYRRPGMMELLPYMAKFWREEQEKVIQQADSITKMLSDNEKKPPSEASLDEEIFAKAYSSFVNRFDEGHGGFGSSPKFPVPHNLTLLLRYWKRYDDPKALEMVEKTLTEMRLGGIYDHIGLGFHRYSTDKKWLLPHFEKMLYDQALLAIAYLEAFQATKNPFYAQTTREIFQYVLRDMTSEEGGFYSAEDADSEGEEGKFYLWTPKEIRKILSPEDATFFIETYHIEKGGNFQDQSTGKKTGESIPHLTESPNHLAQKLGVTSKEFSQRWEKIRQTLFTTRERRIHPFKDDKILTDWNGLMIAALAKGYQVLDDPQYLQAARRAADFILTKVSRDGQLQKRYRQGSAGLPAHLEDYAFFLWGLLDLYEASLENNYLKEALRIHTMMVEKFWDDKNGGFYMTAHDGEVLLLRKKDSYDGAIPSGNSIAALSLVRLGKITANSQIEEKLELLWKALSAAVIRYPSGHSQLLVAWDFSLGPAFEIVLCGERKSASTNEVLDILYHHFIPRKVVIFREKGEKEMDKIAPYTKNMKPIDPQKTTVYACENFSCRLPTTDYESLRELLLPKAR